jgi:hypothetical protein
VQKRETVIVIAKVQRGPQPGRKLCHEAEPAAIPAGDDAVEDILGETYSKVLIHRLFDDHVSPFARPVRQELVDITTE